MDWVIDNPDAILQLGVDPNVTLYLGALKLVSSAKTLLG